MTYLEKLKLEEEFKATLAKRTDNSISKSSWMK